MIFDINSQLVNIDDPIYGHDCTLIPSVYFDGQIEKDMGYDLVGERHGRVEFKNAIEEFRNSGFNRRTFRTFANVHGDERVVKVFLWHPKLPMDRVCGYVCYPDDEDAVRNAKHKQSDMDGML